ncbi:DUF4350 domain-containing protein [Flavobacteriaceae bacterium TP-CH-4]|uniref:DUF4350 domain-containing protein n=1 Tax=Pelagihabitans pacificus TaxID=2696054 RepID=A0A967AWP5_9FLAO|nr:DUF4350 domain-containing protein [Pelagihabitans pacificus]NHF61312.1 DUF4350 domain-containing protein [Pelagihabitans pacificus]
MRKKGGVYILIAVLTLGLLLLLQYNQPKKLNWFPSFVAQHKIPYGSYVFNTLVEELFPNTQQVTRPPYQYLNDHPDIKGTYFFANGSVAFAEAELNTLLEWTAEGNSLFIASSAFEPELLDTLGLDTQNLFMELNDDQGFGHRMVHPELHPEKEYPFLKDSYTPYFGEIDTSRTKILGMVKDFSGTSNQEYVNIVKQPFGKGTIILSTFPKAVTNYFILKNSNKDYTAGLLSYIDKKSTLYMDNYYKDGKAFYTSPMYIFLNNKALKWAYYLALIGALIYVLFEGKRKQRAIPIVRPLKNQTLAFTRTIADMYYEKQEQKPIAEHKIDYFLEYIRSHFYLGTIHREEDFYKNLASRSSHSVNEVKSLFEFFERLRNQQVVTDVELKKLNTSIEKFKKRADGRT